MTFGFSPYRLIGVGFNNFHIYLHGEFARKALNTELPEEMYSHIQRGVQSIIKKTGRSEFSRDPCVFIPDDSRNLTQLLHRVETHGNACALYLDMDCFKEFKDGKKNHVRYVAGNALNEISREILLASWFMWQDNIETNLFPDNFKERFDY